MEIARSRSFTQPHKAHAILAAVALVGALAALIAATHASAASRGGAQIKVGKTALGRILVNAQGRTLYMFAADKGGKSVCYGKCATFWPPLLTTGTPVAGTGVTASLLGTTTRTGGKLQATYKGHPLYRFLKDTKSGQTSGQGLNASGGLWWVMSPAGTVVKKTAAAAPTPTTTTPTTTTTTTTTTGGGYGTAG
jgi:predicted lipoprotein with Yx(FWY)xxD motif